ncbi:MAG: hypothetical protein QMD82_03720 [bacterium]|nr:hypothetical protein [bacterium]
MVLLLLIAKLIIEPIYTESVEEFLKKASLPDSILRLYQVYPSLDSFPEESTFFRIGLISGNTFAVYFKNYQKTKISSTVKKDDQEDIMADDFVLLFLDTGGNGNTAYGFQVNPLGTKRDFILSEGGDNVEEWDGRWQAKTEITDYGYDVLILIPLSEISYTRNPWGVKLGRFIAGAGQFQFSNIEGSFQSLSHMHKVNIGFEGLKSEESYRSTLQMRNSFYVRGWTQKQDTLYFNRLSFGGNFRFKKGTSTVLDIVVKPDFSEIEADVKEISLRRRPIYYPEKREVFMEGKELYSLPYQLIWTRAFEDISFGAKFYTKSEKLSGIAFLPKEESYDTLSFGKINFAPLHGFNIGTFYLWSPTSYSLASFDFSGVIAPKVGFGFQSQISRRFDEKSNLYYVRFYRRSEFKGLEASASFLQIGENFVMPFSPIYFENVREYSFNCGYGIPLGKATYFKPQFYFDELRDLSSADLVERYINFEISGARGPYGLGLSYVKDELAYLDFLPEDIRYYSFLGIAFSYAPASYNNVGLSFMKGEYLGENSYNAALKLKISPLNLFNAGVNFQILRYGEEKTSIFQLFGLVPIVRDRFVIKPYVEHNTDGQTQALYLKNVGYLYLTDCISILFLSDAGWRKDTGSYEMTSRSFSVKLKLEF